MTTQLRPLETRILEMRGDGMSDAEIGRRVRKSSDRVAMIAELAQHPARGTSPTGDDGQLLSPLQRRVLALRSEGETHEQIGERFRRSARYIRQVEGLARFRQYRDLLG